MCQHLFKSISDCPCHQVQVPSISNEDEDLLTERHLLPVSSFEKIYLVEFFSYFGVWIHFVAPYDGGATDY
jgi:hypothetical protein